MTNKELSETARQAMQALSATNMLDHERTVFKCLLLFRDRLEKIEIMRPTIEHMREEAFRNISDGQSLNLCSWDCEEGLLIKNKDALNIYDACFS